MSIVHPFCRGALLLFLVATATGHASTVVDPKLPELAEPPPVWIFIDASKATLKEGDQIVCRCDDDDAEAAWYVTTVVSIEADGTLNILKPMGEGVFALTQISQNDVLDVARKLEP